MIEGIEVQTSVNDWVSDTLKVLNLDIEVQEFRLLPGFFVRISTAQETDVSFELFLKAFSKEK